MSDWISVKDRLPTWQDGEILIYNKDYQKVSVASITTSNRWKGQFAIPKQISHWMPMPEPPKGV